MHHYRPFAIICHIGSIEGGHYVTVARNSNSARAEDSEWYIFNDDHVEKMVRTPVAINFMDMDAVADPYIIFYVRMD